MVRYSFPTHWPWLALAAGLALLPGCKGTGGPQAGGPAAVSDRNRAPRATDQQLTVDQFGAVEFDLAVADDDGDALTFELLAPQHGTVTGTAPKLRYAPSGDYVGPDSVRWRASDGRLQSDFATVTITVNRVNRAPTATAQTIAVDENGRVAVVVTGTDPDGDRLTFSVTQRPANGTLTGTAPNLTYAPRTGFFGNDSFRFVANDGRASSEPATVAITVREVHVAPTATNLTVTLPQDTSRQITLTGEDADGDRLTFAVTVPPQNGALSGTAPNLTYRPRAGYVGADSFRYVARDSSLTSPPATVSITVTRVNRAPTATAMNVTTAEDTPRSIVLAGTDRDGDPLTFRVTTQPTQGRLSGTPPNLTYTPNRDYFGPDQFLFRVSDGTASSADATVSITVSPVNDAPIARGARVNVDPRTPKTFDLSASDVDGDALTFQLVPPAPDRPMKGRLRLTGARVTYEPNEDACGEDGFEFTVSDGRATSNRAYVAIMIFPFQNLANESANGIFWENTFCKLRFSAGTSMNVRVPGVDWGRVQAAPGAEYDWSKSGLNRYFYETDPKNLYPVIRLLNGNPSLVHTNASDAEFPPAEGPAPCGGRPKDLNTSATTLEAGTIYSQSFYDFMRAFALRYPDKFKIVVIENEMNDPRFWCHSASVDDYIKVVITARKAFRDAGSKMLISDGGVQGFQLVRVVVDWLIERGRFEEALVLFEKALGPRRLNQVLREFAAPLNLDAANLTLAQKIQAFRQSHQLKITTTLQHIHRTCAQSPSPPGSCFPNRYRGDLGYYRTKELMDKNLWRYVDVANFHLYEGVSSEPWIIEYMRAKAGPNKPIFTNEAGSYLGNVLPEASEATKRHRAGVDLIKRFAYLKSLAVEPILWFPFYRGDHDGWFIHGADSLTPGHITWSFYAFNTFNRHLAARPRSSRIVPLRNGTAVVGEEAIFDYPTHRVSILWVTDASRSFERPLPAGCQLIRMLGTTETPERFTVRPEPVFVRCPL